MLAGEEMVEEVEMY
jgi:hypothetical protein